MRLHLLRGDCAASLSSPGPAEKSVTQRGLAASLTAIPARRNWRISAVFWGQLCGFPTSDQLERRGEGGEGSLRVKMRPPTTKKSCRGANVEVETHKENWHLRKLETWKLGNRQIRGFVIQAGCQRCFFFTAWKSFWWSARSWVFFHMWPRLQLYDFRCITAHLNLSELCIRLLINTAVH